MWRPFIAQVTGTAIGVAAGIGLGASVFYPHAGFNSGRENPIAASPQEPSAPAAANVAASPPASERSAEIALPAEGKTAATHSTADQPDKTTGAPALVADEPTFQFGEAEQGTKVAHVFAIRNAGTAPLEISGVKPSCGCTTAKLDRSTLAPGESATISSTLDLRGKSGAQNQQILVQSNDPKNPNLRLALAGKVNVHVLREPARLDFGRLPVDGQATGTVMVQAVDGFSMQIKETHPTGPNLAAQVEELEPGKRYQVTVSFGQPLHEGKFQGAIRLVTDDPGPYHEIILPVQAQIGAGGPIFVGDTPEIAGPTLGGGNVDLASLRGNATVIVFWASWCGHCKQEVPKLVEMYKQYHSAGLNIVGVSNDQEAAKAEAAIGTWQVPWPNIHFAPADPSVKTANPLAARYEINGVPAIFLLDSQGKVVATDARGETLEKRIKQLLHVEDLSSVVGSK
jgi:thiol-disulfide isomerase/thioredoxin